MTDDRTADFVSSEAQRQAIETVRAFIMGTITVQIPQNIQEKYVISNPEIAESLVKEIKAVQKKGTPDTDDILKGLFSNDIDLIDRITEAAMEDREHHRLRVGNE